MHTVCMFLPDMLIESVSPPTTIAKSEHKYTRHWFPSCSLSLCFPNTDVIPVILQNSPRTELIPNTSQWLNHDTPILGTKLTFLDFRTAGPPTL